MKANSPWGDNETQYFYSLTPEKILDALESSLEVRCTGRAFAHNSMENRVYELEIELEADISSPYQKQRIVKFYRPGRWSKDQILEEHHFLKQLSDNDIPVVAPTQLNDGKTLHQLEGSQLYYCVFPKIGGRAPHELDSEQIDRVGRLLARMHNVGASLKPKSRLSLEAATYGENSLNYLLKGNHIPLEVTHQYEDLVNEICAKTKPLLENTEQIQIHGDCHLGNLLWGDQGPFWVDFDDSLIGPPVQDLWLMILGRDEAHNQQLNRLVSSYETMRPFDWDSLALIEPLRALRLIHFSGWIARRYQDPSFKKAFPEFGTARYWNEQIIDLNQQLDLIRKSLTFQAPY